MRRLPVYILLDTSGSMRGEPIHSVNVGLQSMLSALRQDPYALESVYLSVITFDIEAKVYLPLTPLDQVQIPDLDVPNVGATFMGAALELLAQEVQQNVQKSSNEVKGDWRPLLFLMTDGSPSDVYAYQQIVPTIKQLNFATIVACAAGPKAKTESLLQLTDQVVVLDTMDSNSFASFFKWVSASVVAGSSSAGVSDSISLPPPPAEIQLVL
ncbi:vWA domain-containing protein [Acinetobacter guillouiae]|uniref:vWA domain-containing protein n=1 Tax=Acinetobacter guillouiae TaxID=106649 RepID=UPI0004EF6801|nr:VWA domain-containing protein [Acinetobacter guillouiae]BAP37156.1 putative tellurite resistance protein [Acinetobacter guillouiae]